MNFIIDKVHRNEFINKMEIFEKHSFEINNFAQFNKIIFLC